MTRVFFIQRVLCIIGHRNYHYKMEHQSLSVLQKDGIVASYCFFLPSLHYSNEKWGKLCLNCLKDKNFIISFFWCEI